MKENIKQTFSIALPVLLYEQLLQEVGRGRISSFVRELVEKELNKTSRSDLKAAYQSLEDSDDYQKEAKE
jgi:predicted transcriptional regulator